MNHAGHHPPSPTAAVWLLVGGVSGPLLVWGWWPCWNYFVDIWQTQSDYSHGFLVPFIAGYLFIRRLRELPDATWGFSWLGPLLLVASAVLRITAVVFYLEPMEGWSIPVWVAGVVGTLGGRRVLAATWPAIAFLLFMTPMPWQVETALSHPLQRLSTQASGWLLQVLGYPAVVEGNTILLDPHRLEVARACSGLRMFMGVAAMTLAYLMLARPRPERAGLLLFSLVPVALAANALRIAGTGVVLDLLPDGQWYGTVHDVAGWCVIPLAALLLLFVVWFAHRLFIQVEPLELRRMVHTSVD